MNYSWLDEHCLARKGAVKDYKAEWNATRYMVDGKMFAMRGGDKEGKPIITFKHEPLFGDLMRKTYTDIVPGYYMNKEHWSSLYLEGEVPDDVVRELIDHAYETLLRSFSQKARARIEAL